MHNKKYYPNENIFSQIEISKDKIDQYKNYVVAHFLNEKLLCLTSIYDQKIIQITYFKENFETHEAILPYHRATYSGIKFKINTQPIEKGNFIVETSYLYNEQEQLTEIIQYWIESSSKNAVQDVFFSPKNNAFLGSRLYYFNSDDLLYTFDYDKNNKLYDCYDFEYSERVSNIEHLINQLPDLQKMIAILNQSDYRFLPPPPPL